MSPPNDLGVRRGTVKLAPYNPNWSRCFGEERRLLLETLGTKVVDIRHIGSTSISGLPAKPIIDILAAVNTLADVERFTGDLATIGYEDKGDGGVAGRRFFVKGSEANRTHHLNFCEIDSEFWTSHLLFRDYLVRHPVAALEYETLKRKLAERFPQDRNAYTSGKEQFVRRVLERAARELRRNSR